MNFKFNESNIFKLDLLLFSLFYLKEIGITKTQQCSDISDK